MISKKDLECIRDDFSDIDEQYRNIEKEIWGLEENPIVKKYIGLQKKSVRGRKKGRIEDERRD